VKKKTPHMKRKTPRKGRKEETIAISLPITHCPSILEKRGEVAYQLELPSQLSDVNDVFHVSQLKKCLRVPKEQLPMEDMDANEDLSYQEYPVKILETSKRVTQNKRIKICKVQWSHHTEEEATWEREGELKAEFASFFFDPSESRGQNSF
jgi:hypothetical protein